LDYTVVQVRCDVHILGSLLLQLPRLTLCVLFSFQVTAGVLRGERARFQLFGDTMNTASRMETTGLPNMIHVSSEFVCCLEDGGKSHWASPREDKVLVKGKGYLQTYFLDLKNSDTTSSNGDARLVQGNTESVVTTSTLSNEPCASKIAFQYSAKKDNNKIDRLVEWNVDLLTNLLKEIVASRNTKGAYSVPEKHLSVLGGTGIAKGGESALSEVQEIIKLPAYSKKKKVDPKSIVLKDKVVEQLRTYIMHVAHLYQDNPFHNFEHASHVSMSVVCNLQLNQQLKVDLFGQSHHLYVSIFFLG
jgi:Adenylate and Guanylate cyclase catalytic domain